MAKANLSAKHIHKRVNDELAIYGGEREVDLLNLIPKERTIFDYQSLVLSYFRDHGNLDQAANKCGIPIHQVYKWEKENVYGFADRVKWGRISIAARIHSGVIRKIESGEIGNPSLTLNTLKILDPETFDNKAKPPDDNLLDQLRKERLKDKDRFDEQVAEGVQEYLEKLGIEEDDPEAPAKARKILKLQRDHHGSSGSGNTS